MGRERSERGEGGVKGDVSGVRRKREENRRSRDNWRGREEEM